MAIFLKRKKEAKKEKRVKMWITLRVPHILTRQTNNNIFYLYKNCQLILGRVRIETQNVASLLTKSDPVIGSLFLCDNIAILQFRYL